MPIKELKQALEAATPGPWNWHNDAHHPGKYEWSIQPGVLEADGTDGTPGGDKIDRANARLIVEAVNNLPKLLKVAEAAEEAVIAEDAGFEAVNNGGDLTLAAERMSDAVEALRKALEELNNGK